MESEGYMVRRSHLLGGRDDAKGDPPARRLIKKVINDLMTKNDAKVKNEHWFLRTVTGRQT